MRRPRRRALAVRGTGCLAPSAQAAGGQQSHRFLCAPAASPTVCACPVTPYSAVRDVQALRPRAGAAPRRGTGSPAAPRRWGCLSAARFVLFLLPAAGYLLEGTNPTSRRVQRPRPPWAADTPARNCSSYVDGGCAVDSKPAYCSRTSFIRCVAATKVVATLTASKPSSALGEQPVHK